MRALEPAFGRWPWPRFVHAAVINYLARNHARMIVYDVLLPEPDFLGNYKVGGNVVSGNESDAELRDGGASRGQRDLSRGRGLRRRGG